MGFGKELLILGLVCGLGKCISDCKFGYTEVDHKCVDVDECEEPLCGNYTKCFNTDGSYYCQCQTGFRNINGNDTFTGLNGQCKDYNECRETDNICGRHATCTNLIGNYNCTCHFGYIDVSDSTTPARCEDINECVEDKQEDICGKNGNCENVDGSYWCMCLEGYTNYGNKRMPCSELNCDRFGADDKPAQSHGGLADILSMMRNSCLALSNPSTADEGKANGDAQLERLLTATDVVLSPGYLDSSEDVSRLLSTVENSILIIGPQLKGNRTKIETTETGEPTPQVRTELVHLHLKDEGRSFDNSTVHILAREDRWFERGVKEAIDIKLERPSLNRGSDAEIAVRKGNTRPTGPIHLTSENARLDTDWTTAAGTGAYPGFALAALLTYKNLHKSVNGFFGELKGHEKDGVEPSFQVFSRVVSVVVSNPSTQNLSRPVNITLKHQQDIEESPEVSYICAYWNESGGAWSTDGCYQQQSNATHTVCTCEHLSSFAVLMALYPIEHTFGLLLATKIGLSLSLLCLILSILTFKFCRSIQGTRTTIHLHLCICLFMADLIFLAGISQTKPVGGCRFVAALLHFFFLGVFTWMLLEGVQLYRMVVLVFNATIRPLYLYVTGYGAPLAVVIISAIIRPHRYGTDQHCWLSVKDGLIWSFFGPVCLIIILNVFFFIITVWKLAQKFTSLNPDLSKLHKIKAFTVTAIAQMCILGLMWVFGAFLFEGSPTWVAYIFTILNSLQGALLFIMHCLLSKQVREEYAHFLSCICTPQKKRYSDFTSTNPSSSQSQGTRSGQHTGESQI